jgi:hypothetical protein
MKDNPQLIKSIKVGLENPDPGRVAWRSLLESALFEIESLTRSRDYYRREMENWKNIRGRLKAMQDRS